MKYTKTAKDIAKEKNDLEHNVIIKFLKNQDSFKFKVGDILIKHTKAIKRYSHSHEVTWEPVVNSVGAPKKFMYVFENELGIGYIRQLKVDGKGFGSVLYCVANFDPNSVKFSLDPEYADHLLLNQEEDFNHNKEYLQKKKFRKEAIEANNRILLSTKSSEFIAPWFLSLKVGDQFWMSDTYEGLIDSKHTVLRIAEKPMDKLSHMVPAWAGVNILANDLPVQRTIEVQLDNITTVYVLCLYDFVGRKLTNKPPFSLKESI